MNRRRTPRPAAQARALIALAALPLALSTSSLGVTHASDTRAGDSGPAPTMPPLQAITADDLPDLPDADTLEAVPAAFQVPERTALGKPRAGDIPWVALHAYRRAADILAEVQPSCGLSWALLGAVGQVESEHGTARGGDLGDDGVVSPDLVGRPLDGRAQRPAVEDTDGGAIDGDDTWDRAVGPMQLLPGVWSLVAVDGDGDGARSPQDVDDAALAAAVYLCAVGTDLADPRGAAQALAEYNGTEGYADQVLAVQERYAERDFAVSGAPEPSSIGTTLDGGRGTPARESERALRRAQEQREPSLTARRPQPSPVAGPSRTDTAPAKPKPSAAAKPSPTAQPGGEERVEAAPEPVSPEPPAPEPPAPEPVSPEPPAPGPTAQEPTAQEPAVPEPVVQPAQQTPADGSTDEGTGEPTGKSTENPGDGEDPGDEADAPADDSGEAESRGDTEAVTGVLSVCGEDLCLDDAVLDLTAAGDLDAEAGVDLDGDDVVETLLDELAGLEGRTVELVVVTGTDPLLVVAVDDHVVVPD